MKIKHDDNRITYRGRTIEKDEVTYFNYTCSGFQFKFRGKQIKALLKCDNVYENNQPLTPWLAVVVDQSSEVHCKIELTSSLAWYTLFECEDEEEHLIEVFKLTEAQHAKTGILALEVDGIIEKSPLPKTYKIEFIGDSITCGYGNETNKPEDGFKTYQENGLKTYASLSAKYFNASYHCVSVSGIGVYSSYTEQECVNDKILMPNIYKYTDYLFESQYENPSTWDFARFIPDLIVLNLGTNDYALLLFSMERYSDAFVEAYVNFLEQIRQLNGKNIPILCTLGAMRTDMFPLIEKAVDCYKIKTGDTLLDTMAFSNQCEGDGIGGNYHPTVKTHEKMARELRDKIKNWLGWDYCN